MSRAILGTERCELLAMVGVKSGKGACSLKPIFATSVVATATHIAPHHTTKKDDITAILYLVPRIGLDGQATA